MSRCSFYVSCVTWTGGFTFSVSGIWQVVHVAQQLHEVAPQSRHDIRRIPASQAPHHPYGQSPYHPGFIIQCHKQGPQTAHTHTTCTVAVVANGISLALEMTGVLL